MAYREVRKATRELSEISTSQEDMKGVHGNDDSKRRHKKRKLESLVSRYEFAPRVRYSSAEWSEDESFVLLEVWGEKFLQLRRKSLRSEDWIEVAEKVSKMCKVEMSHVQCRNKLDVFKLTLVKYYRNI
ncbi:hypothetical protein AgCh_008180 [Apium graveolens]